MFVVVGGGGGGGGGGAAVVVVVVVVVVLPLPGCIGAAPQLFGCDPCFSFCLQICSD